MASVQEILWGVEEKAEKAKKTTSVIFMIQSIVELGSGWHSFREVLSKGIKLSGNAKMKYYPIQDVVKLKLAEIDAPKGVPMSDVKVRIKPEFYNQVSDFIHDYFVRREGVGVPSREK